MEVEDSVMEVVPMSAGEDSEVEEVDTDEDFYVTLFTSVQQMYKDKLFCDLVLLPE